MTKKISVAAGRLLASETRMFKANGVQCGRAGLMRVVEMLKDRSALEVKCVNEHEITCVASNSDTGRLSANPLSLVLTSRIFSPHSTNRSNIFAGN